MLDMMEASLNFLDLRQLTGLPVSRNLNSCFCSQVRLSGESEPLKLPSWCVYGGDCAYRTWAHYFDSNFDHNENRTKMFSVLIETLFGTDFALADQILAEK